MSTPTPAATLPTRQQLDEIDALLQRMLSLPAVRNDDSALTPSVPPIGMTFEAPVIREDPPIRPRAPEEPLVKSWRVQWPESLEAPSPSVVAWGSPVPMATAADEPDHSRAPGNDSVAPTAIPLHAEAHPGSTLSSSPATVPLLLWPLIVLNLSFNALTHLFGPYGAWLRGPGRMLLGWLGIGLIVATGIWAAGEWLGYEWPRLDLTRLQLSKLGLSR